MTALQPIFFPLRFRQLAAAAVLATTAALSPIVAKADDEPTFRIEFKDGTMSPTRIEVPAGKRFRLELVNVGTSPAEFESLELRKEKVVAPGVTSSLVFKTLDAGEYPFFDEFHPDAAKAILVAK